MLKIMGALTSNDQKCGSRRFKCSKVWELSFQTSKNMGALTSNGKSEGVLALNNQKCGSSHLKCLKCGSARFKHSKVGQLSFQTTRSVHGSYRFKRSKVWKLSLSTSKSLKVWELSLQTCKSIGALILNAWKYGSYRTGVPQSTPPTRRSRKCSKSSS